MRSTVITVCLYFLLIDPAHMLDTFHDYADPRLRYLRE